MPGAAGTLKDLIADDDVPQSALEGNAVGSFRALAGEGWMARVAGGGPRGPGELFLAAAYQQVRARTEDRDAFYSLEADTEPLGDETIAGRPRIGPA
jgi:ATP-dependent DNA helicase DinG